jgi:hypothetical protein
MLTPYILAAILSTLPSSSREADRERLEPLAVSIAAAIADAKALPFRGPAGVEASALALVAIAAHESSFHPEVLDCRKRGDGGHSVTAFQLHDGAAWGELTDVELCGSFDVATPRALRVLTTYGARASSPQGVFSSYAGGEKHRKEALELCAIWQRLTRARGLDASCKGTRTIGRARGGRSS